MQIRDAREARLQAGGAVEGQVVFRQVGEHCALLRRHLPRELFVVGHLLFQLQEVQLGHLGERRALVNPESRGGSV